MISKILFVLNLALLIFVWVFTISTYRQLPEIIPIHFGADGKADGFGKKEMSFFLAGIATLIFLLLNVLSKKANSPLLNIPDSMRKDPKLTEIFTQGILFFCMLLFAELSWESTRVALGKFAGLSWFTPVILALMFVFLFGFKIFAEKFRKKNLS